MFFYFKKFIDSLYSKNTNYLLGINFKKAIFHNIIKSLDKFTLKDYISIDSVDESSQESDYEFPLPKLPDESFGPTKWFDE